MDFFPFCVALSSFIIYLKNKELISRGSRGPAPLNFRPKLVPKGRKKFFFRDCAPPPLSEGLDPPLLMEREGKIVGLRFIRNRHKIGSTFFTTFDTNV